MVPNDPHMAPSDLSWHEDYERAFARFDQDLHKLQEHPAFSDAEDLGDYVETMDTLLSFRPRTRDDIVRKVNREFYPEIFDGETEG